MHGDGSRLQARPVVVGEDALHRKTLEQTVGDHTLGAATAFLGRLKNELHGARPAWVRRQQRRCTEQRGRMAVMATGMHDVGVGGGVGNAAGLQDRQRVHVGAQADGAVGPASPGQVPTTPWPPTPAANGMPSSVSRARTKAEV